LKAAHVRPPEAIGELLFRRKTMRYLVSIALLGLLLSSPALALTYLGPTTTNMRAGQWAVGANYMYSEQDVEVNGATLRNFEWQTALATVHLGLDTSRAEIFGRIGIADMERRESVGIEGDTELALGFGTRITTNPGQTLSWGIAAQFLWWQEEERGSDADLFDIQIGLGPCWRSGNYVVYGGPMLHFVRGDLDRPGVSADIEEKSWFGGYLGGGIDVDDHLTATLEFQMTADGYGLGLGARWRF
jgi:hypothetical protein